VVPLTWGELHDFARAALAEDIGLGDVTTLATVPSGTLATARLVAREPLVLAGLELGLAVFRELDRDLKVSGLLADGSRVEAGGTLGTLRGAAQALLTAERVALNCIQRLSGIATRTAAFVDAVAGTGTRILDTRKTTPGWRRLEKYAVTCAGGTNHRQSLGDLVLIKDNHLAALRGAAPNPVAAAIAGARRHYPYLKVEVEADTLEQVRQAIEAGADIVLMDNMSPDQLRDAVRLCKGHALSEASGGVRLEEARAVAASGVDFLSVGALTHSARWMDIGLDFEA
jgi:nicotinate-nucleotide pyrophosphorylase (carboxylating)